MEYTLTPCPIFRDQLTALDHIAYEIAVPNGGDPKKVEFPFPLYRDELDDLIKRYTLDKASAADLAAIKACRPWKRGNVILYRLHELDIIDKHRGLLPCLGSLSVPGGGGVGGPLDKFLPGNAPGGLAGTADQMRALGLSEERDNPINFEIMLPPSEGGEFGGISATHELRRIRDSVDSLLRSFT